MSSPRSSPAASASPSAEASSSHFLRLVGQHRPLGVHRHFNAIPLIVALQSEHAERIDGAELRSRILDLYDVQGLEELVSGGAVKQGRCRAMQDAGLLRREHRDVTKTGHTAGAVNLRRASGCSIFCRNF